MSTQADKEYEKFTTVAKRILKKELSVNPATLSSYREQIVEAYNVFVIFVQRNYHVVKRQDQAKLDGKLEQVRSKLEECLRNLKCHCELPNDLQEQLKLENIGLVGSRIDTDEDTASTSNSETSHTEQPPINEEETENIDRERLNAERLEQNRLEAERLERNRIEAERIEKNKLEKERIERERLEAQKNERKRLEAERIESERLEAERLEAVRIESERLEAARLESERQELARRIAEQAELERLAELERVARAERERIESEERQRNNLNMTDPMKAQKELLDIVNGQIRKPYDGEPLGLETFLTGVEIAKEFATSDELQKKLLIFVKGRLEARARELITDDIKTIDELISKLRNTIKPEKSRDDLQH